MLAKRLITSDAASGTRLPAPTLKHGVARTLLRVLLQRTGAYRASLSSDAPDILVRTSGSMVSNWDAEWLALWSRP